MPSKPVHRRAAILHDFAGNWQTIKQACERNDDGVYVLSHKKLFEIVGQKRGHPVTEHEIEKLNARMYPPEPPKPPTFFQRLFSVKRKLPRN